MTDSVPIKLKYTNDMVAADAVCDDFFLQHGCSAHANMFHSTNK